MSRTADDSYSIEFFFHTFFLGFAKQVQFVSIAKFVSFSVSFLRLLQKARLKRNNAVVIRDSLRNEMSKRSKTEEENREKREQLVSENKYFGCQDYNSFLYLQWFRCRFLACVLVKSSCITKFINIQTQATATKLSVIITAQNMKSRRRQQQHKDTIQKEKRMEKVEED